MAVDLDTVRILYGDTDATQLLTDAQLTVITASATDNYLAAAIAARALAAKYSRSVSFSVEGLSIQNSTKAANYLALAKQLEKQAAEAPGALGTPLISGVSISDMVAVDSDPDRVAGKLSSPAFDQDLDTTEDPAEDLYDGTI